MSLINEIKRENDPRTQETIQIPVPPPNNQQVVDIPINPDGEVIPPQDTTEDTIEPDWSVQEFVAPDNTNISVPPPQTGLDASVDTLNALEAPQVPQLNINNVRNTGVTTPVDTSTPPPSAFVTPKPRQLQVLEKQAQQDFQRQTLSPYELEVPSGNYANSLYDSIDNIRASFDDQRNRYWTLERKNLLAAERQIRQQLTQPIPPSPPSAGTFNPDPIKNPVSWLTRALGFRGDGKTFNPFYGVREFQQGAAKDGPFSPRGIANTLAAPFLYPLLLTLKGKYGEYGEGLIGQLFYILSLPQNIVLGGATDLYNIATGNTQKTFSAPAIGQSFVGKAYDFTQERRPDKPLGLLGKNSTPRTWQELRDRSLLYKDPVTSTAIGILESKYGKEIPQWLREKLTAPDGGTFLRIPEVITSLALDVLTPSPTDILKLFNPKFWSNLKKAPTRPKKFAESEAVGQLLQPDTPSGVKKKPQAIVVSPPKPVPPAKGRPITILAPSKVPTPANIPKKLSTQLQLPPPNIPAPNPGTGVRALPPSPINIPQFNQPQLNTRSLTRLNELYQPKGGAIVPVKPPPVQTPDISTIQQRVQVPQLSLPGTVPTPKIEPPKAEPPGALIKAEPPGALVRRQDIEVTREVLDQLTPEQVINLFNRVQQVAPKPSEVARDIASGKPLLLNPDVIRPTIRSNADLTKLGLFWGDVSKPEELNKFMLDVLRANDPMYNRIGTAIPDEIKRLPAAPPQPQLDPTLTKTQMVNRLRDITEQLSKTTDPAEAAKLSTEGEALARAITNTPDVINNPARLQEVQQALPETQVSKSPEGVQATQELVTAETAYQEASEIASEAITETETIVEILKAYNARMNELAPDVGRRPIEALAPYVPYSVVVNRQVSKQNRKLSKEIRDSVFFHGSKVRNLDLTVVDPIVGGSRGELGTAIYFTSDFDEALDYALAAPSANAPPIAGRIFDEVGTVYTVKLDIKNPLVAENVPPPEVREAIRRGIREATLAPESAKRSLSNWITKYGTVTPLQEYYNRIDQTLLKYLGYYPEEIGLEIMRRMNDNIRAIGYDSIVSTVGDTRLVAFLGFQKKGRITVQDAVKRGTGDLFEQAVHRANADRRAFNRMPKSNFAKANVVDSSANLIYHLGSEMGEVAQQALERASKLAQDLVVTEDMLEDIVQQERRTQELSRLNEARRIDSETLRNNTKDGGDFCL